MDKIIYELISRERILIDKIKNTEKPKEKVDLSSKQISNNLKEIKYKELIDLIKNKSKKPKKKSSQNIKHKNKNTNTNENKVNTIKTNK